MLSSLMEKIKASSSFGPDLIVSDGPGLRADYQGLLDLAFRTYNAQPYAQQRCIHELEKIQ
jgi:hypothetical protein